MLYTMCLSCYLKNIGKTVSDKVKDYEQLRGGVILVDDIPRSPAGKLKRDELKNLIK